MPLASPDFTGLIESLGLINGRFSQVERLAAPIPGYFSLLFKATDLQTGQPVVLKFFDPNADDYRSKCFSREARILTEIGVQANILTLVSGEDSVSVTLTASTGFSLPVSLRFYVVELADGSLGDYIYSGHTNSFRSLILFREACKGVQRLHAMRIFHRDIKPPNCLTFGKYRLKLSDFGTARRFNEPNLLPDYWAPIGDMNYTSPELFAGLGSIPAILQTADMFALGAILFELFTGQILTSLIYEPSILDGLIKIFGSIKPDDRPQKYDELIPGMVSRWKLPELSAVGTYNGPAGLLERLSRMYKQLACLDYRQRELVSFQGVFRDINTCLAILRHDARATFAAARRRARISSRVALLPTRRF